MLVDGVDAHARVVEEAVVVEGLAVLLEVSEEGDVLGNGGVAPVVELGHEGLRGEDAVAVDDVVGGDLVGVGVGDVAGAPADNPRISALIWRERINNYFLSSTAGGSASVPCVCVVRRGA